MRALLTYRDLKPKGIFVDFLLIGGGGGGRCAGGGAGGVIQCCEYILSPQQYSITIGAGNYGERRGGNSVFDGLTAYGGGGSGMSGGSGGGRNGTSYPIPKGCPGQGYDGGNADTYGVGGGGGAGGCGACGGYQSGGNGGPGIQSDISGTNKRYAGGGGGYFRANRPAGTSTAEGRTCAYAACASVCGSGGGGQTNGYGGGGIFILRYPTSCGYDMTGGTCYTCGDYTIHCFTSSGTLCVN